MELWEMLGLAGLVALGLAALKIVLAIVTGRLNIRHLPGVPSNIFFGCLSDWLTLDPVKCYEKWRSAYGDVVAFMLGASPMVMVCDPTYAGQVVTTMSSFPGHMHFNMLEGNVPNMIVAEGQLWKFLRSATSPIFQKSEGTQLFV